MSDDKLEPSVEYGTMGSGRKKFENSLGYVRDLEKNTRLTRIGGIALALLGSTLICLRTDPPTDTVRDSHGFEVTSLGSPQEDPTRGDYSRGQDAKNLDAKNKNRSFAKIKLTGPRLLLRSIKLKIPPGTEAQAILINGASNGLVKAKLREDVVVAGELFLSAGAVVMGQGTSTEERLFIKFNKVVLEDGSVSSLQAEAADSSDKIMGLKGSKISSHAIKIAAGAGLNFLAGASTALEDTQGEQGAVVAKPTLRNAILQGTAKSSVEEANNIASQYKNAPPILAVKAGTEITIIFTDDGG